MTNTIIFIAGAASGMLGTFLAMYIVIVKGLNRRTIKHDEMHDETLRALASRNLAEAKLTAAIENLANAVEREVEK